MKTRSNMPLFVLEVDNVKTLSNSQIDLLRCGDYLVKKDVSGEHAYKVTFKSDTGMCITYHDASVVETQSYDKIDGVWTYNSEDKTPNLLELQNVEDAPDGTINKALGLDSSGKLVKGSSGGTKKYLHRISFSASGSHATIPGIFFIINDIETPYTTAYNIDYEMLVLYTCVLVYRGSTINLCRIYRSSSTPITMTVSSRSLNNDTGVFGPANIYECGYISDIVTEL